jgi:hypothetical protein
MPMQRSPGYEATILDWVGSVAMAIVAYAASYSDGGKRLKFRTLNADNGYWGSWTSVELRRALFCKLVQLQKLLQAAVLHQH